MSTETLDRPKTGGGPSITILIDHPDPEAMADRVTALVQTTLKDWNLYAPVRRLVRNKKGGCSIDIQDDITDMNHPVIDFILKQLAVGPQEETDV